MLALPAATAASAPNYENNVSRERSGLRFNFGRTSANALLISARYTTNQRVQIYKGVILSRPNWNESDSASGAYIQNKPTIPLPPGAQETPSDVGGTPSFGSDAKYAPAPHVHGLDPDAVTSDIVQNALGDILAAFTTESVIHDATHSLTQDSFVLEPTTIPSGADAYVLFQITPGGVASRRFYRIVRASILRALPAASANDAPSNTNSISWSADGRTYYVGRTASNQFLYTASSASCKH